MDAVTLFNAFEVVLWTAIGILIAVRGRTMRGMTPRVQWLLAVSFLAFGISDGIEIFTGAWWRPLGLLTLKGACVAAVVVGGLAFWHDRWRTR